MISQRDVTLHYGQSRPLSFSSVFIDGMPASINAPWNNTHYTHISSPSFDSILFLPHASHNNNLRSPAFTQSQSAVLKLTRRVATKWLNDDNKARGRLSRAHGIQEFLELKLLLQPFMSTIKRFAHQLFTWFRLRQWQRYVNVGRWMIAQATNYHQGVDSSDSLISFQNL